MKKLFLSILLLTSIASAFTFDVWTSKITLDEAILIAQKNNIPLRKDGIFSGKKGFYKPHLFLEKYPNNRVFRYTTKLLNENATVYLYFTKNSKELYNLKVRWGTKKKEIIDSLYTLLDKKYGKRKVAIGSNIGEFIIYKKRQWNPNNDTLIQTKTSIGSTELNYYDVEESHKEDEERKKTKIEKKEKALIKDANKF